MAGMVDVKVAGSLIHARYVGKMSMDLVREAERRIEAAIAQTPAPVILYDCEQMDPPEMALAMEMKAFDARIRHLVGRAATVVRDPTTAFTAKVAFALTRNHRVFYHDVQEALRWLNQAPAVTTATS